MISGNRSYLYFLKSRFSGWICINRFFQLHESTKRLSANFAVLKNILLCWELLGLQWRLNANSNSYSLEQQTSSISKTFYEVLCIISFTIIHTCLYMCIFCICIFYMCTCYKTDEVIIFKLFHHNLFTKYISKKFLTL